MVVVMPPSRQHLAGMGEAVEDFLIEVFVPQLAIEALREPVLLWLARCDECQAMPVWSCHSW